MYLFGHYGTMLFILTRCWRGRAQRTEVWTLWGHANLTDIGSETLLYSVVSHPASLYTVWLVGTAWDHAVTLHKHAEHEQGWPASTDCSVRCSQETSTFLALAKSAFSQFSAMVKWPWKFKDESAQGSRNPNYFTIHFSFRLFCI